MAEKQYAQTREKEYVTPREQVPAETRSRVEASAPMPTHPQRSSTMTKRVMGFARPRLMGMRAGNTSYQVIPQSYKSVDSPNENVEVEASQLKEVAETDTSQVQSTQITAYHGSSKGY